MRLNVAWHRAHPMRPHATLDDRVAWHLSHAKACGCRGLPATVAAELKRRGLERPTNGTSADVTLSAFGDRELRPTGGAIQRVLRRAGRVWTDLKDALARDCGPLDEEWSFAGQKYGWSLRLKRGQRAIVYLTPRDGDFLASFALGEKACAAARDAGLAAATLAVIDKAPRYPEGRGVRIPVRTRRDAAEVRKVAAVKLAH